MEESPRSISNIGSIGCVFGNLNDTVGKTTEYDDNVSVLVIVASIGHVKTKGVFGVWLWLLPNLELAQVLILAIEALHRKAEEVVAAIISIALIDIGVDAQLSAEFHRRIVNFLQVLVESPDFEERMPGLDERLVRRPRVVLLQELLLLAGLGLLPANPGQLLDGDIPIVMLLDGEDLVPLVMSRPDLAMHQEPRVGARNPVGVA